MTPIGVQALEMILLVGQTPAVEPPRAAEGLEVTFVHGWPLAPWLTMLGFLLAAVFVFWVYRREAGSVPRSRRFGLAAIRLLVIGLVMAMMYGWMQQSYRTDLPDVVVVLDDSQSMAVTDRYADDDLTEALRERLETAELESPSRINVAKSLLLDAGEGWLRRLREDYNLKFYFLGVTARSQPLAEDRLEERVGSIVPEQPASRLGDGLQRILDAQRGRPTAAIIMLTDGVTTEGKELSEAAQDARRKQIPLFLLGLGDERPPRDLRLSDLLVDEVVFVGDVVNFDFKLAGTGFSSEQVVVRLKRKGRERTLVEQEVEVPGDGTSQSVRLVWRPVEQGDFEYVVEVESLENETNLENNQVAQRVSVQDETIRVLLVQEYPSLEFRFLKTLLERGVKLSGGGKAIQLTSVLQEADPGYAEQDESAVRLFPVSREELFDYDVVIFGDVNPAYMSRAVLENLAAFVTDRGGGLIFLAGPRHTPAAYRDTPLEKLLPVDLGTLQLPDADEPARRGFSVRLTRLGLSSPPMQLAESPASSRQTWSRFPPIRWVLRAPDKRPGAHVLLETIPSAGEPPRPIIFTQLVGAGRIVFHATDETYLWSRLEGSDRYYERYWLQTVRYLSRGKLLGADRSVEVLADQSRYYRGEVVPVQVRFFDQRMAPAADDGVEVFLERANGRRRRVTLDRDALRRGMFSGSVSNLPQGDYRLWLASPRLEGTPPTWRFSVVPPPGEQAKLTMDAEQLEAAAKISDGEFFRIGRAERLWDRLPAGRQVRIGTLPPEPIWNSPLVVALLIGLLVAEWVGRRRVGWL